jgi:hypothetical protein
MFADLADLLAEARAAAELRMTDSCAITRNVSTDVLDADGFPAAGSSVAVYSGMCLLDDGQVQNPNPRDIAGDSPVVPHFTLVLPVTAGGSTGVVVGDVVVMTACPDHPRNAGIRLRVSSANPATQKKAQTCQVDWISG